MRVFIPPCIFAFILIVWLIHCILGCGYLCDNVKHQVAAQTFVCVYIWYVVKAVLTVTKQPSLCGFILIVYDKDK